MIQSTAIQITPEILGLVAGIDEFKGAWRALGTLAPDRLSALLRVATIESIGSSTRIEGSSHNPGLRSATAQVARESLTHLGLIRMGIFSEQRR